MNDVKEKYLNKYIRITKLECLNDNSVQNSHTESPPGENWWAEGFVEIFNSFLYIYRIRNYNYPKGSLGFFYTSVIQDIEEVEENGQKFLILTTLNSKYRVEEVEEFKIKFDIVDAY